MRILCLLLLAVCGWVLWNAEWKGAEEVRGLVEKEQGKEPDCGCKVVCKCKVRCLCASPNN